MKKIKNGLFSKFENSQCVLNDVKGGTLTSLGQTNLDHYGKTGCDDIEYSSVQTKKDRDWTEFKTSTTETFLTVNSLKSSMY